jgi:hypothetical protein
MRQESEQGAAEFFHGAQAVFDQIDICEPQMLTMMKLRGRNLVSDEPLSETEIVW